MALSEFAIIKKYFTQQTSNDLLVGIGDDCAVIPKLSYPLSISVDTSIAGKHFPQDAPADLIAARALNVAVSDLAAMAATPKYFTLSISLPPIEETWLKLFSTGLFKAAKTLGIELIGGDTTAVDDLSSLSISITVMGIHDNNPALCRNGAKVNDYLYVTGPLGDAAMGLKCYFMQNQLESVDKNYFLTAYLQPKAKMHIAKKIASITNACIDISDGFLQDLDHILSSSNLGAIIDLNKIPLSKNLLNNATLSECLTMALTGGDDYELCFTSSVAPESIQVPAFCIGRLIQEPSIIFENDNLNMMHNFSTKGYDHFK